MQFIISKNEVQIQSNSLLRNIAPSRYTPTPPPPPITTNFTIIWSLFIGHKILAWERWCATARNLTCLTRCRNVKSATSAAATRALFFRFFQLHAPLGVRFTSYIMLGERSRNSMMRRPFTRPRRKNRLQSHTLMSRFRNIFSSNISSSWFNNNSICSKNLWWRSCLDFCQQHTFFNQLKYIFICTRSRPIPLPQRRGLWDEFPSRIRHLRPG